MLHKSDRSSIVVGMTMKRNHYAEELMTPGEAATRLGVQVRSLARMAERGDLRSIRLPSGHRRYSADEINALAAGDAHSPALASGDPHDQKAAS